MSSIGKSRPNLDQVRVCVEYRLCGVDQTWVGFDSCRVWFQMWRSWVWRSPDGGEGRSGAVHLFADGRVHEEHLRGRQERTLFFSPLDDLDDLARRGSETSGYVRVTPSAPANHDFRRISGRPPGSGRPQVNSLRSGASDFDENLSRRCGALRWIWLQPSRVASAPKLRFTQMPRHTLESESGSTSNGPFFWPGAAFLEPHVLGARVFGPLFPPCLPSLGVSDSPHSRPSQEPEADASGRKVRRKAFPSLGHTRL